MGVLYSVYENPEDIIQISNWLIFILVFSSPIILWVRSCLWNCVSWNKENTNYEKVRFFIVRIITY